MNDKKRILIMSALLGLLVVANLYVRLSEDSFDSSLFSLGDGDLDGDISARQQRALDLLADMPRLSFRTPKKVAPPDGEQQRNPFIFGVDQRLEEEQQARMEALAQAREAALIQADAVPAQTVPQAARFEGELIGVMHNRESGERLISVFHDNDLFILRTGETLADRYRLLEIGTTHIRFLHLPDQREIKIDLELD